MEVLPPQVVLLKALEQRAEELSMVEIISLSTYGEMPLANLDYENPFILMLYLFLKISEK